MSIIKVFGVVKNTKKSKLTNILLKWLRGESKMNQMLMELMSGLGLFLFGMKFMSESLQRAAGEKLREILGRITKNKYVAVIFGAIFTAIIQSSGATTVMEVSFVNAGLLTLEQSVGITFGANIGTTITSQLVSLKLTDVAPFIVIIGAVLMMFGKKPLVNKISSIIFGFGALFLGINNMTAAMNSLQDYPKVLEVFSTLSNPFVALLLGLILTVIVQSSSVTVSVLVLLADSGLVGLGSCLYFILGANIGSCTPAVMAGMSAKKDAKRVALVHLLFNVLGMVIISAILVFFKEPVIDVIARIGGTDNAKRFVANADTIFKIFQTIIFLPISAQLVGLTKILVPGEDSDTSSAYSLRFIGKKNKFSPATAVVEVVQEIERMAILSKANLIQAMEALLDGKMNNVDEVYERERQIDYLSKEITDYLVAVNQYELPLADSARIGSLFHVVNDVERIGDHAVNIVESAISKEEKKIRVTDKGHEQITKMYYKVLRIYDESIEMFVSMKKENLKDILELEDEIDQMQIKLQKSHVKRLAKGECTPEAGLIYTDLTTGLERIADHATNIAFSILPEDPEEEEGKK